MALGATVGLAVTVLAPALVAHGRFGAALAATLSLILLTRVRHCRSAPEFVVAVLTALAATAVTIVAVVLGYPQWRPALGLAAGLGALAVLAGAALPGVAAARRARFGDLIEGIAMVALIPVLAFTVGALDGLGG